MGKSKRILIVDDTPNNLRVIMDYVLEGNENYQVLSAINGELALKIAKDRVPDLIILDWKMPVMDGLECLAHLKKTKSTKDIPVVMATGVMLTANDLKQALEAGAIDYIRKPIDKTELNARIKAALKLTEYYNDKLKAIKEKEAAEKEAIRREIMIKVMKISQMDKINEEVLDCINKHCKEIHENEEIINLKAKLENIININKSNDLWVEFESHFNITHQNFYKKLHDKHPELTNNEKRLSAFLLLGLSTKEIARITIKSIRSIEIARTRLRDKLNLKGKGVEINAYLNSF